MSHFSGCALARFGDHACVMASKSFPRVRFCWPDRFTGAVTSSWDDGNIHDRQLLGLFRNYGFKGSFYLTSALFRDVPGGSDERIASSEVAALYAGMEVGSHSATHPRMWTLPPEVAFAEMIEDRRRLEELCGDVVTGFVFPFGRGASADGMVPLAKRAGFLYARRSNPAKVHEPPADFFNWDPSTHCGSDLPEQWEFFKQLGATDRLFNVWGHSYEFERRWGWDHIEKFLAEAAATPGLWFATNREIYEYISAWRGLRWSLDLRTVRNPSATPVDFTYDAKPVRIGPGELIHLEA